MNRRLFLMFALATLAACGENSSTGPVTVNLVGSWKLQSVNGSALPFSQTTSTGKYEIFDGSADIQSSGAFTINLTQRTTTGTSISTSVLTTYGTVDISSGSVIFKRQDIPNDPGTAATLTADTITLTQNGYTLAFVKQQ